MSAETASSVTLKQPENKTVSILRSEIDEIRSNGVSLMPVGLEKIDLARADVRPDLVHQELAVSRRSGAERRDPMIEVELKYRLADSVDVPKLLAAYGAQVAGERTQRDVYFQHPVRDFRQTDEAFRIRCSDETNVLTYKGPLLDRVSKARRGDRDRLRVRSRRAGGDAADARAARLRPAARGGQTPDGVRVPRPGADGPRLPRPGRGARGVS
ncbi:MAG: class IV adenylate cyclase [Minicystis sp.]